MLEILCKNAVIDQRIVHNICNQYSFIERLKFGDNFIESLKFSDKIDANKFISGNISTSITKEKDVEKKKEKETETKSTYKTSKTRKPFIDLISLPFSVVGKAFFKENIINDNPIIKE